MLTWLPGPIVGVISYLFFVVSTAFIGIFFVIPLGILKIIIPHEGFRALVGKTLEIVPLIWNGLNQWLGKLTRKVKIDIRGDLKSLNKHEWYLVMGNHQSWVEIFLLAELLNGRAPSAKFFFKREVLWLPIVGFACWALDFPVMRRYSKSYLKNHPEKKGKDLEEAKKACEKYKRRPTTIVNFVEGTRFTPQKQRLQQSPYKHLLKPKAGGVGLVMSSMGNFITKMVHVTFVYPTGKKTFWDFLSNRMGKIVIVFETHPVTPDLIGNYVDDAAYRVHFQHYLNDVWRKKDELIESILKE